MDKDIILKTMKSIRLTLENTVSNEKLEEFDNAVQEIKKPNQIVVFLEGGLVQEVYTKSPTEMVKIDLDTEGADKRELSLYPDSDGNMNSAFVSLDDSKDAPYSLVEQNEKYVDKIFNYIKNQKG